MSREIDKILNALAIQPILIDIGASGSPPDVWQSIARHSIYVGFDPDRRELHDTPEGQFRRSIIVNEAVSNSPHLSNVNFYLTKSPYCSSTLPPDTEALSHYLFSNLFMVDKEATAPASTLSAVMDRLKLPRIDWFKTDSQGTDLRLFQSLADDIRNRVLAVDIEPGLIDAYRGEDLFVDAHRELLSQGFWLSSLDVQGTVRMKQDTLRSLTKYHPALGEADIYSSVHKSPGWCEARYLRTLESLDERNAESRDYALLWCFAMIEKQWGYALDISLSYEQKFQQDNIYLLLRNAPLKLINRENWKFKPLARKYLPRRIKKFILWTIGLFHGRF